jgi:class 3 adenylate cyclase
MEPGKAKTQTKPNNPEDPSHLSAATQDELDRRLFHLKTLYDVSKDLFVSTEPETILRNGLLMAMGAFGVAEGFVAAVADGATGSGGRFVSVGFAERELSLLKQRLPDLSVHVTGGPRPEAVQARFDRVDPPPGVKLLLPFALEDDCAGLLGLGAKLVEEQYSEDDRELLGTLGNNLAVALKNARSFERIRGLNVALEAKNRELEGTLKNLKDALRKVEILESVKASLCKFVPTSVTRLVETSPGGEIREARERDLTVLFLDIEGYTRLTEEIGATRINALTERYFSVFMDAIYENNGDVVETAGDGLMVIFLADDPARHACEALRAAQTIMEKTDCINRECRLDSRPIVINMGICSGQAFVGASRFESLSGDRWTYTSHGTPTNVAARLCSHARSGAVLVSQATAERAPGLFAFEPLGRLALKNISGEVEVFALRPSP